MIWCMIVILFLFVIFRAIILLFYYCLLLLMIIKCDFLMIGWQQFEDVKDHIVPPTHPVYELVSNVVKTIVDSNQDLEFMREQTWTILVVDSKEINAFVLPVGISWFDCAIAVIAV